MGLLDKLRKKDNVESKPSQQQNDSDNVHYSKEYYSPNYEIEKFQEQQQTRKKSIFNKLEKRHEEQEAKTSLSPYKVKQRILIWNYGTGEKIYGYPVALIPRPHGECIILYRKRMPSFFDEIWLKLREIILGKKESYRVLYVPEECIGKSDDIITIYAHSFRFENNFTEVAIPLEGGDIRKRMMYEIALKRERMYQYALEHTMNELSNIIEYALYINPTLRTYRGRENKSDKKGEQSKEFEGAEFSFDGIMKKMVRDAYGGDR